MENPITLLSKSLFNMTVDLHWSSPIIIENCKKIRQFCADYVVKRQKGEVKSQVNNVDMLSLFMETPEVFTNEFIVDELMDFFFVGICKVNWREIFTNIMTPFIREVSSLYYQRSFIINKQALVLRVHSNNIIILSYISYNIQKDPKPRL